MGELKNYHWFSSSSDYCVVTKYSWIQIVLAIIIVEGR